MLTASGTGFVGDFRGSEWAGATASSPDGKWLFANIQSPGHHVRDHRALEQGRPVMFGLGATELLIVLVVVLVLFGGSQLPKLARSMGQAQREFQKGTNTPVESEDAT